MPGLEEDKRWAGAGLTKGQKLGSDLGAREGLGS